MKPFGRCSFAVILFASVGLLATAQSSRAGNESSGGDDIVILPDDRVVLADAFVIRPGQPMEIHPALKEELLRVDQVLKLFGESTQFIRDNVLSQYVEYRYVTADQLDCARIKTEHVPEGSTGKLIACTQGPLTLISEDDFKKLTVRDQARLIVHERLHDVKKAAPHGYIADITDGIVVGLNAMNTKLRGERIVLTPEEAGQLEVLMQRIIQLEMGDAYRGTNREWLIWPNGGGMVHRASTLHSTAYVGYGSKLGAKAVLGENSAVFGVVCDATCKIGANTTFPLSGRFSHLELGSNVQFVNSELKSDALKVGDNTVISDSTLQGFVELGSGNVIRASTLVNVRVADFVEISGSNILLSSEDQQRVRAGEKRIFNWISSGAKIVRSEIGSILLGANSSIENSEIKDISLGKNGHIQNSKMKRIKGEDGVTIVDSVLTVRGYIRVENNAFINSSQLSIDADLLLVGESAQLTKMEARARVEYNNNQWQMVPTLAVGIVLIPVGMVAEDTWFKTIKWIEKQLDGKEGRRDAVFAVAPNAELNGSADPICPEGYQIYKKGLLVINSLEDMTKRCKKQ